MTDDPVEVEETPEERQARAAREYASIVVDETIEERQARASRGYAVQGLTHRLHDPDDPYSADDHNLSGKGEE